jgi:hypothetical protein
MKRRTICGILGAVLFVAIGIPCCFRPDDPGLHGVVQTIGYVCYPVVAVWELFFKILGIEGEHGMAYILPMIATTLLYLAVLGYAAGSLIGQVWKER